MSHQSPLQPHALHPEHPPEATLSPTEQFMEKNYKKILLLVVVAILAVIAVGMVRHNMTKKANAAAEEFTRAKTVEDCDLVISKYPGTLAAGNALLTKAELLWSQTKKDSAIAALQEFVTKHSDHPLFATTEIALASKLESTGKTDEAKAIYERIGNGDAKSEFTALAKLRLADLLWQTGKEDEAKQIYTTFPQNFTGSTFFDQNKSRQDWVAAAFPTKEVDGPKPPPAPPEPPAPKIDVTPGGPAGAPPLLLNPTTPPAMPTATVTPSGAVLTNPAVQVKPDAPATTTPAPAATTPAPAATVKPTPTPSPIPPQTPAPVPPSADEKLPVPPAPNAPAPAAPASPAPAKP
jgi:predicted negative regulator of RcsB-dependent stress response